MRAHVRLTIGAVALGLASIRASAQGRPEIDSLFARWDRTDSPGCTLGIVQDGRVTYRRGYGMANLDYGIPNGPDIVYYVGSDSKQFTAASIALLALAGRISLDDDIRKYFPEMRDYGTRVTVRQLVYHTAGIRDIYVLMSLAGKRLEDVFSDAEALALIARQKELNFTPGTDHLYSNSGYFLLGQLVKRVTGQSLRVFADSAIFRPLGMTRTHFHDDPGHVMPMRSMAYEPDGSGGFRLSYIQNFDKIGAGGLYTTLDDLAKWDENYYTHRVGGDALQVLIHTRAVLASGDTLPYAFGNNVTRYRGQRITEHSGALMGFRADVLRFPDLHTSVITMCNLANIAPEGIALRIADVILADRLGPRAAPAAARAPASVPATPASGRPVDPRRIPGTYHSDEVDATWTVRAAGSRWVVDHPPFRTDTLTDAGPGRFTTTLGAVLTFDAAATTPRWFSVEAGRVRNIRFDRRAGAAGARR